LRGAAEMPRVPPRISLHSSRPTCRRRVLSALPQAIAPELLFAHRTLRHPRVTRSSLAALPAQGPRGQSGGLPLGAKGAWASVTAPTAPNVSYLVGTFLPGLFCLIVGLKLRQDKKPKKDAPGGQ